MTPADPLPSVAAIAAMARGELIAHWRRLFGGPPPKSLSAPLMRRFLAFETQARSAGGPPAALTRRIARLAKDGAAKRASPALRPGARLVREWHGATHVVEVVEGGFLWRGARHRSLSSIARAITGARWSGPRFFGLDGPGRS